MKFYPLTHFLRKNWEQILDTTFIGALIIIYTLYIYIIYHRLALRVLLLAGTGKKSLLLAIMLVTTALSMFICNTATCAMIVPILTVVLDQLYTDKGLTREKTVFYLAVAYCANIGGTGTVTAEETNLILMVGSLPPSLSL